MTVRKTSVFPASRETVFRKLQRLDTLQYIARPYATFEPMGDASLTWEAGITFSYRLWLFGIIPYGVHTIHIVRCDPTGISSREENMHVPVWHHTITLAPLEDGRTRYGDQVEIQAGWKTLFIWLWANAFYRHRQRKWIKLLKETDP